MEELFEKQQIKEQKNKVIVAVGRFQPPTIGHYKVINEMKSFIRNTPDLNLAATPIVVIVDGENTSKDKSKNPLTVEERIKFMQSSGKANGVIFLTAKSALDAFYEVRRNGFEPIVIAAGSDRNQKYIELLDKYFTKSNGDPIKHTAISGLERHELSTNDSAITNKLNSLQSGNELDVSEVSASMARTAVKLGYEEEFSQIVGLENKPKLSKIMFDKVKKSLSEKE